MIHKGSAGETSELAWFKSSYSDGPDGDSCVEIATTPGTIHVRDSKYADSSPRFTLSLKAWADFVPYVSEG
ncbi:DUF397 domain-containing protein [Streptomyces sp. NPDC058291]|uniref:DUF397 domain-containing protein n=1 Tax=Streptomyces sp. NPDC058291 TaxID=3346427 RepID=UPI0036ED8515